MGLRGFTLYISINNHRYNYIIILVSLVCVLSTFLGHRVFRQIGGWCVFLWSWSNDRSFNNKGSGAQRFQRSHTFAESVWLVGRCRGIIFPLFEQNISILRIFVIDNDFHQSPIFQHNKLHVEQGLQVQILLDNLFLLNKNIGMYRIRHLRVKLHFRN